MTATVQPAPPGVPAVTIRCAGCLRSATTDAVARAAFLEMIGWSAVAGSVLCSCCQVDRGLKPRFGSSSGRLRRTRGR